MGNRNQRSDTSAFHLWAAHESCPLTRKVWGTFRFDHDYELSNEICMSHIITHCRLLALIPNVTGFTC